MVTFRTPRHRQTAIFKLGVVLILIGLLSACSSSGTADTRPPAAVSSAYPGDSPCPPLAQPVHLIQPVVSQSAALAWLYVAQQEGLFQKCGLDVQITQAQTGAQQSSYLAGDLPFADVGGGFPAAVAATRRPMNVYALLGNATVFSLIAQPGIHTPRDLTGKVIAVLSPVDSTYKVALHYLQQAGIDPKSVTFSFVNTMPNISAAVESGAAAAGVMSPPTADIVQMRGFARLKDFVNSSIDNPQLPVVGDPSWVAEHPNAAANMLRAIVAAVYLVKVNPEVTRKALTSELRLDPNTAEGKVGIDAALTGARQSYSSINDILAVNSRTVNSFKETAPPDLAGRLKSVNMDSLLPREDLGAILLKDGFVNHLAKLYGPLPEN